MLIVKVGVEIFSKKNKNIIIVWQWSEDTYK